MALIWRVRRNGKCYEVRRAGRSHRLYTDGVFHTQYNPARFLTGNVWDLLSLPGLLLPPAQVRRIAVLGVGGGTVLQQLRRVFPEAELIGIELDAIHLRIARRFFLPAGHGIKLIQADAIEWMKQYRGQPFDIIVDDLFGERDGEPVRVIDADPTWCRRLRRHLSAHGMLIFNFIALRDLRRCACLDDQRRFPSAFRFSTPLYENYIGVFCRSPARLADWRIRLKQQLNLAREFTARRDKYRIAVLR